MTALLEKNYLWRVYWRLAGVIMVCVVAALAVVSFAASLRLRPVLSTMLTTVAGLLPLGSSVNADPIMGPMALSLGYGLVFSVPITLFLVPCLYLLADDFRRWGGGLRRLALARGRSSPHPQPAPADHL